MNHCLHHVIERRADESPAATAVETEGGRLDYRTLDRAANHLAARLRAAGAGPGDVVAIYGRVRPEVLVAMLAVLKAGAAYLPLDPGDPAARTRAVLAAARPVLVLAVDEWAAQAGGLGAELLVLGPEVLTAGADRGEPVGAPGDLAYVLFTSGSTGRPKGVLVEHRNLVNYCAWVARANRVGGRVAPLPTVTRFVFDASVQQLLAPLTRGDAVWMVPEETARVPERLLAALRARPGAGLHCVPALWEEILELLAGGDRPALSSLFLGGEAVRPDLWRRTRATLPDTALANVYGPTEATVQATGGFQAADEPLSVGRPVDGVTVAVLDESRRPVPPGRPGEVWLGGAGVARGYLDDPELTARRFVPAGELGLPGERWYRTGDEGCLLPDGSLRVLGRLDDQLKIRGFRIEPAEVEAVLGAQGGVRAVAVVSPADGPYAGHLCAAIAGGTDPTELLAAVRDAATGQLPPHLVPAQWRVVDSLPRTASGKLDRRAVAGMFRLAESAGRPLATETERVVAGIWSELLGREVHSADDDFFALGGHSLLANRVAARLRRTLGATDALRVLFDERTVGAVAAAISATATPQNPSPTPADGRTAGTGATPQGGPATPGNERTAGTSSPPRNRPATPGNKHTIGTSSPPPSNPATPNDEHTAGTNGPPRNHPATPGNKHTAGTSSPPPNDPATPHKRTAGTIDPPPSHPAAPDNETTAVAASADTTLEAASSPGPLSVQQEAIWAAERALAGTPFNHVLFPVSIFGPLDLPAITAAVGELVAGQPALRTRFDTAADGTVTQLVMPAEPVGVPVVDVRDEDRVLRDKRAMTEARAFHSEPVDLARGQLLRARLLRLADEEWVLLLGTHHIVCDGVSLQVILSDLVAAYRRRVLPDGTPRPATAPSYVDFARTQRRRLAEGEFEADFRHWQDKLREPVTPAPLAPPPARPVNPFRFGAVSAPLGASLVARLREFGRRQGATPFMCLAAALAALVHRRTGSATVRLGTLAANREFEELSRTVGVFATTVVLGFPVRPTDTYRDLVRTARAEVLAGQEHQRVPLELALSGTSDPAAPFQVGLSWEPARPAITVGRTGFAPYRPSADAAALPVTPSSTDLSVIVAERDGELVATVEHRMSTIDRMGAEGFLRDLYGLLDQVLSTPDAPVTGGAP